VCFLPAKRPRFIFVACLALSVMGTFTLAAADLPAFDLWENKPATGGSITNVDADYAIDCLAEYTVKLRGGASLPSRKSTRAITLFGTLYAGPVAFPPVIMKARPAEAPGRNNTILLKLRI
jgi:hypothetical protein